MAAYGRTAPGAREMSGGFGFDFDMHQVREAVAGMMADRHLEHPPVLVMIAGQDAQARTAARNIERSGNLGAGGHRLDILRHPRHRKTRRIADELEQRVAAGTDGLVGCIGGRQHLGHRRCQIGNDINLGQRDRLAVGHLTASPRKRNHLSVTGIAICTAIALRMDCSPR